MTFNPLLHTWSLSVEEQFYLFWPLLIALGLLVWRSRNALLDLDGAAHHRLLRSQSLADGPQSRGCVLRTAARAWEFGLGGLATLVPRGALRFNRATWIAIGWLGVLLIIGSACRHQPRQPFPGWRALFPVIGTALTLLAGAEQPLVGVGAVFNTAPLQTLGGLSYSWYLWHWPFLVFTAAIVPGWFRTITRLSRGGSHWVWPMSHTVILKTRSVTTLPSSKVPS